MPQTTERLSQSALARALGLSSASVTALKRKGMPIDSVEAAAAWRESNQRAYMRPTGPTGPTAGAQNGGARPPKSEHDDEAVPGFPESRARREAAAASIAELELQKMRGTLVEASVVRSEFARQTSAVRDGLLQLPARLAPVLAAEASLAVVQQMLDTELRAVLAQFTAD